MDRRELLITAAATGAATMTFIPGTSAEALEKDFPEFTVAHKPENDFSIRLHTWAIEQELDGKHDDIVMSRDAYKHLRLHNQIDDKVIGSGALDRAPFFAGHRVRVPGSSLA